MLIKNLLDIITFMTFIRATCFGTPNINMKTCSNLYNF